MFLRSLVPKCPQWWIYTFWTWWRPITPLQSVTSVFYKRLLSSVFRGINKCCAETSCLYSSTRVNTSPEVLICCSWQDTGVYYGHPPLEHHSTYAESPQPPSYGPSAQMNTHEHLLSPPEIRVWMLQLLTGGHTILRFPSWEWYWWQVFNQSQYISVLYQNNNIANFVYYTGKLECMKPVISRGTTSTEDSVV